MQIVNMTPEWGEGFVTGHKMGFNEAIYALYETAEQADSVDKPDVGNFLRELASAFSTTYMDLIDEMKREAGWSEEEIQRGE